MTSPKRPKPLAPEILEAGVPDRQDAPDYGIRVREFERLLHQHLRRHFSPARAARLTSLYESLRDGRSPRLDLKPDTIRKDRRILERACLALAPLAITGLLAFGGTPTRDTRVQIESLRHEVDAGLDALEQTLQLGDPEPIPTEETEADLSDLERRLGIAKASDGPRAMIGALPDSRS